MKKNRQIKLFLALMLTIFATCTTTNVSAEVFGGKFTRGISRVSYYIYYNSGTGFYEYLILDAEKNWENPGWPSPVNMVAASSNAGTMLDIYTKTSAYWGGNDNVLGATTFYDSNGTDIGEPTNRDYVFTRIYLNDTSLRVTAATKVRHIIIHEMGHCFGLAHTTNTNSIMYPSLENCNVDYVQQVDVNNLINLYK